MKGLELSERYFNEYGRPVLESEFGDLLPFLACGLAGAGSECLGYDDEISRDHDFEPGFCIFIPGEDVVSRRSAFLLERAYARLPNEFMGFKRSRLSPAGGSRLGVIRTMDFYRLHAGMTGGEMDLYSWFSVPSQALREAVSGKVFFDNYGEFTRIREMLKEMPQDVRLKKLAGHLFLMNQSGQYNYPRLIKRGDKAAAQLAAGEFVKSAMEAVFLMNREYMPYYKWSFRALKDLDVMGDIGDALYGILTGSNDGDDAEEKYLLMEKICSLTGEALTDMGLTRADCSDMQKHAFSVNDMIRDADIRNLGILYGV